MDKKEYFEKILDRSTEELVKEFFPHGITTQEKPPYKKTFRICCGTGHESRKKFLPWKWR